MSQIKDLLSQYIFAYAYPIAFVGALLLGISETVGYNPSTVISEKVLMVLNVIVGVAGAISLFNWFGQDVPVIGSSIVDRSKIKTNN
jgi:hypothetical protein